MLQFYYKLSSFNYRLHKHMGKQHTSHKGTHVHKHTFYLSNIFIGGNDNDDQNWAIT